LKLNEEGEIIWKYVLDGQGEIGFSEINDLKIDVQGNLIAVGRVANVININLNGTPEIIDYGGLNLMLLKLSSDGEPLWQNALNTNINVFGLEIDSQNNLIVNGNFRGAYDFDPGVGVFEVDIPSQIILTPFVSKFNEEANLFWVKFFNECHDMEINDLATLNDTIIAVGHFQGTIDFDPGFGEFIIDGDGLESDIDMFLLQLNPNGEFISAYRGEEGNFSDFQSLSSIIVGEDGIYFAGSNCAKVDIQFGGGEECLFVPDDYSSNFVFKTNHQLQVIWKYEPMSDNRFSLPSIELFDDKLFLYTSSDALADKIDLDGDFQEDFLFPELPSIHRALIISDLSSSGEYNASILIGTDSQENYSLRPRFFVATQDKIIVSTAFFSTNPFSLNVNNELLTFNSESSNGGSGAII